MSQKQHLKIEGDSDLLRDRESRALINTDRSELTKARTFKKMLKDIEQLKYRVSELEKENRILRKQQ